jgi:radical SAM superfamily enzyme YgiQ (UPF0313 family)
VSSVVLINPNLIVQRNDPLTTGIVYMPLSMGYAAGALRADGHVVTVIDAFAQKPKQAILHGKFMHLGLTTDEVLAHVPEAASIVFLYAINLTNHDAATMILRAIKAARPELLVIIQENTQAVTAYALAQVADVFYQAGADYILTGEAERTAPALVQALKGGDREVIRALAGVGGPDFYNLPGAVISDAALDELPYPAWDLFPLENYWKLDFAHGPLTGQRYLPMLTSRGCPYPCKFCVVPATNNQKWRARTAANVVDEMQHYMEAYGVREFHIEDLDPTISDSRIRDMCTEIITRGLDVDWKLAAGTKVETIRSEETIDLMAQAGCTYISISPETGSPKVLKLMRKPFDLEHAVRLVKRMNEVGIRSQSCFVLGFPGEEAEDRQLTYEMVHELTRKGVDEVAFFIITPVPGSAIYEEYEGYNTLSDLNFTPTWRADYETLSKFRLKLYASFLWWKLRYHPLKIVRQVSNFLLRRFETKMEMVPFRALVLKWRELRAKPAAVSAE